MEVVHRFFFPFVTFKFSHRYGQINILNCFSFILQLIPLPVITTSLSYLVLNQFKMNGVFQKLSSCLFCFTNYKLSASCVLCNLTLSFQSFSLAFFLYIVCIKTSQADQEVVRSRTLLIQLNLFNVFLNPMRVK